MATFLFELVSPERLLFEGQVSSVQLPASDGDITVMAGHAPLMATLKPGVLSVADANGAAQRMFVRGGFADVSARGLTILAEQAVPMAELTPARLDQEIAQAEATLASATAPDARIDAQEHLARLQDMRRAAAQ